ncbi:hypothetical protein V8G54_037163 [Vigna mungo]|uniref:F-box domain-containing protein n=1 Tax=Vigna mungo TaxID=3915 RepID=A0AAQ3MJS4_VIGMU
MFTRLPDQIILHILSFLDAKFAVQTSVLNKRCRYLWTFLPVINFDEASFQDAMSFEDFVFSFLSCRDTSTNVFNVNLKCHKDHTSIHRDNHVVYYIIEHVIDTPSITTNIEVLTILAECVLSKLSKLSVCTSLTTLKLSNILSLTKNFDIPSLKHLYLCCCQFVVGRVNSFDPFKGCVNLESLHIDRCSYHDEINTFIISTPNLLDLNLSRFFVDGEFDEDYCVIELQTPRLQYFKYDGYVLYCFSTEINLLFVEELYIVLGWLAKDIYSLYTLIELFEIMQRAKSISLSSNIIEVSIFLLSNYDTLQYHSSTRIELQCCLM